MVLVAPPSQAPLNCTFTVPTRARVTRTDSRGLHGGSSRFGPGAVKAAVLELISVVPGAIVLFLPPQNHLAPGGLLVWTLQPREHASDLWSPFFSPQILGEV